MKQRSCTVWVILSPSFRINSLSSLWRPAKFRLKIKITLSSVTTADNFSCLLWWVQSCLVSFTHPCILPSLVLETYMVDTQKTAHVTYGFKNHHILNSIIMKKYLHKNTRAKSPSINRKVSQATFTLFREQKAGFDGKHLLLRCPSKWRQLRKGSLQSCPHPPTQVSKHKCVFLSAYTFETLNIRKWSEKYGFIWCQEECRLKCTMRNCWRSLRGVFSSKRPSPHHISFMNNYTNI